MPLKNGSGNSKRRHPRQVDDSSADGDFVIQPRPGMSPVVPRRPRGNVQQIGGFIDGQSDKVPQLDQLGFDWVLGSELIERFIHGQKLIISARRGDVDVLKVNPFLAATMTHGEFSASPVNEDDEPLAWLWSRSSAILITSNGSPKVWESIPKTGSSQ